MDNFGPVILLEVVLIFGGILLFAWWQLRDLKKEREKNQKKKAQTQEQDQLEKNRQAKWVTIEHILLQAIRKN